MKLKLSKQLPEKEIFPPYFKIINSEKSNSFDPFSLNSPSIKHQTNNLLAKRFYKPIIVI